MAKRLIWTNQYYKALRSLALCVGSVYSKGTIKQFKENAIYKCGLLQQNPLMGSIEHSLNGLKYEYRYILVKPYFKIVYRIENEHIYIITIWDTRRDPRQMSIYLTTQ